MSGPEKRPGRPDGLAWMSEDQYQCAEMLRDLFGGWHHIKPGLIKDFGRGIAYSTGQNLATFDGDRLTRLVFLAHDRMVRIEINPSGPGKIKLCLWKRHQRDGSMSSRHPTVEQALATHRRYWRSLTPTEVTA